MPMHKIDESATGRIKASNSTEVAGRVVSENSDGTVNFRVEDCGVVLRAGDLVTVPKSAVQDRW